MINEIDHLLRLAKEKFPMLSQTEAQPLIKLCQYIVAGKVANFSAEDENNNEPANAANWPDERKLAAEWLIWLCTNRQTVELIPQTGFWVKGARVVGELALNFAKIPFPLSLVKCAVGEINLSYADIHILNLAETHTGSITAHGLKADNVFLRNGFRANGEVDLMAARISGALNCCAGSFINPGKDAISADGIAVGCGVFMSDGFRADGEVRLHGATIRGNFECQKCRFYNKGRKTLNASGMEVKGNVFLNNGFRTNGEVVLIGTKINGSLNCDQGFFINRSKDAISADRIKVEDNVFMRDGFKARGKVRLVGANIGSDLVCDGGQIQNMGHIALVADTIEVNGSVFLRKFKAEGEVRMMAARINVNFECSGCHLNNPNPKGFALNADRINVGGSVHFIEDSKIEGEVKMMGAVVGQYFQWSGLKSRETVSLNLQHAKVGTIIDEVKSWPEKGKLRLDGFIYDNFHHISPISAKERLEWLRRQSSEQFLPQPYEQLAEVLKNAGHEKERIEVLIAKNRDETKRLGAFSPMRYWYLLFDLVAGYGYRPAKAFVWSMIFILLGAILFHLGNSAKLIVPTKVEAYEPKGNTNISANYPVFNSVAYSVETFVPLLKLYMAEYYLPDANRGKVETITIFCPHIYSFTDGSLLRVYLWIHIIAGWFLTTLWVGGLTGLIRR
jgi:sRNA-binding regulator protein Hfq